jgi:hypothetical protein
VCRFAQIGINGTKAVAFYLVLVLAPVAAADGSPVLRAVSIPRVARPLILGDFLDMEPPSLLEGKLAKVEGFLQREPKDGEVASQRTVAYLGYDDKKLYVVFVAFDSEPQLIRAHMTRRENVYEDDRVEVMLDSFHDQRRAYSFVCNPFGIQLDRLYAEGSDRFSPDGSGYDDSFDTLWDSQGKLTAKGYVVLMAIPFRSLRFPASAGSWGIIFRRSIPRLNESSYWPRVSSRIQGLLNQEATLTGLDQRISPGHNIQLIPYGVFKSIRTLDDRDATHPVLSEKLGEVRAGLESKLVLKDRLVLDLAVNPDFSQVESDEPQVTVNQRFEVFFPEKRQFLLENASYFDTPIELLFTRRITDPLIAGRLTGKVGPYAMGALFADDRSPGKIVPDHDPLFGESAHFGVLRVNRDVGRGSTVGLIYTDREFAGEFNRVGGADVRLKLGNNWTTSAQAVVSSTQNLDGSYSAGPAYRVFADRGGRKLKFNSFFTDHSPGFVTRTGFFQRPDIRRFSNFFRYRFRPEGKHLLSHGPGVFQKNIWTHNGTRLEELLNINYSAQFVRQTFFGAFVNAGRERLRPSDFPTLLSNRDYPLHHHGIFFENAFFGWLSTWGEAGWGTETNYVPATGPPVSARANYLVTSLTLRPLTRLTIDNMYLLTRLRDGQTGVSVFNNHIIRSKWNYQINRELSLRFISQYTTTLANAHLTSLQTTKNLNFDFLVTYLVHPGTAFYVGYNSNLQNLDPSLRLDRSGNILRTPGLATNDGRQFFVKASYLFHF